MPREGTEVLPLRGLSCELLIWLLICILYNILQNKLVIYKSTGFLSFVSWSSKPLIYGQLVRGTGDNVEVGTVLWN